MDSSFRPISAANQPPIEVVVADDHPIVRNGIVQELSQHPDIKVIGLAANGNEALQLTQTLEPDVLILDISMPGLGAGDLLHRIEILPRRPYVLVLTAHSDLEYVLVTLKAGVTGYMLKDEDPSMITVAVRVVAQGQTWMSSSVIGRVVSHTVRAEESNNEPHLSLREHEILQILADGKGNQEIGDLLGISERTVRFHLRNIYDKLGLQRRGEAIAWAVRQKQRETKL
jgi:DNA-binding NarL/FixJ family response regulator